MSNFANVVDSMTQCWNEAPESESKVLRLSRSPKGLYKRIFVTVMTGLLRTISLFIFADETAKPSHKPLRNKFLVSLDNNIPVFTLIIL